MNKYLILPMLFALQLSTSAFAQSEADELAYAEKIKTSSVAGLNLRLSGQAGILLSTCSFDGLLVVAQFAVDTLPLTSGTLGYLLPAVFSFENNNKDAPTWKDGKNLDGDTFYKGGNGWFGALTGVIDLVWMIFDIVPDAKLNGQYYKRPFQGTVKNYKTTTFLANELFDENGLCLVAAKKMGMIFDELSSRYSAATSATK